MNRFLPSAHLLIVLILSCLTTALRAQSGQCWEEVRSIDFNAYQSQQEYQQIPGLTQSNNFSLTGFGATGALTDPCAGGYLTSALNYWGLTVHLEAGLSYRLSAIVKGSGKTDFSVILRDPTFPGLVEEVSPPVQVSALGASAPGVAYASDEFTVSSSGLCQVLLRPQEVGGHSGQDYVRIDNFMLEKCVLAAPPTAFFTTDFIEHAEGTSSQVCVAISRAPDTEVQALVSLPDDFAEHFPNEYPRLLTFPAGADAAQCFNLESTANGIYDGLTTYTLRLSALDTGLAISPPDSLILLLEDDTDYSDCAWAGPDHVICPGESVQLGAAYTDVHLQKLCDTEDFCYAWTPETAFGANEIYELYPTVSPTETTEYILWITDGQGNLFTDTVKVEVLVEPAVHISPANPSICQGFVTLTASGLQPGLSYTWSTGETGESIQVSAPDAYTVTATSASGCAGAAEVTVTQDSPNLNIEASSIVGCAASPSVTLSAQSDAAAPQYAWSHNSTLPQSVFSQEAQVTITAPGTYYLAVQDQATGCVNLTEIDIYATPSLVISPSNPILCNGQTVDLQPNWLSLTDPQPNIPDSAAIWQWSTGETSPTITVSAGGNYSVTATFPNGCTYTASFELPATSLELEITADSLFACAEAPMALVAQVTDGDEPLKYIWSTGDIESQITVDTLGIYSVTVSDVHECEYVAEVEVEECPFSCEVQQFAEGYACGSDSTLLLEDDPRLLTQLEPGDSFWAGDFRVEVNSATGAGTFNGRGVIKVPYFEEAQINVWLENVRIDRSCKMIGGEVRVEGVGAKLLSDELADALNDLLETLDEVDNALQVIDQVLGTIGNVVNSSDQIDGLLSEDWNILSGSGPLVDEYPYLPPGLQNDIDNAITCYLTNPPDTCNAQMSEVIDELTKVINEMFKSDFAIHFEPYPAQHYGFDSLVYPQMRDDYGHLTVANREYYVGWKSIEVGATDSVVAVIPDHIDLDSLIFEDNRGNEIPWAGSGGQAILSVPDYGSHEETSQIYPVQLRTDSSGQVEKKYAGKLNVIAYERKEVEVVLVPINGSGATITTQGAATIAQALDRIYQPAVVGFTVELMDNLDLDWFDNSLDTTGSRFYTAYNAEMNDIKSVIEEQPGYDPAKYYIALVDAADGGLLQGFMPRGRNIGFVVANGNLTHTIAHELGHGAFLLKHTFEEFPTLPPGSTDNLMDYSDGTHLHKYQWDLVHNPPFLGGSFLDDDVDAQLVQIRPKWRLHIFSPQVSRGMRSALNVNDVIEQRRLSYWALLNDFPLDGWAFDLGGDYTDKAGRLVPQPIGRYNYDGLQMVLYDFFDEDGCITNDSSVVVDIRPSEIHYFPSNQSSLEPEDMSFPVDIKLYDFYDQTPDGSEYYGDFDFVGWFGEGLMWTSGTGLTVGRIRGYGYVEYRVDYEEGFSILPDLGIGVSLGVFDEEFSTFPGEFTSGGTPRNLAGPGAAQSINGISRWTSYSDEHDRNIWYGESFGIEGIPGGALMQDGISAILDQIPLAADLLEIGLLQFSTNSSIITDYHPGGHVRHFYDCSYEDEN